MSEPVPLTLSNARADRRIEMIPISVLTPYRRNARTHSKKQIRQIADSIKRFGFTTPILIDEGNEIIAGHGRVAAAKLLGLAEIPAVRLSHLSAAEKRAYVLADNKLADLAGWDREILATELQGLIDLDFEVELTGFTTAAIDLIIGPSNKASRKTALSPKDPIHHHLPGPAVCRGGDSWVLGPYRLRCEDAREGACELLLQGDLDFVDMAIRHWQAHSGDTAILASTGQTFGEIEQARLNTRTIATDKTSAAALKEARDD